MKSPSRNETAPVFVGSLAVLCAASVYLISRLSLSGDEPWYLLQGYNLVHFHTVDLSRLIQEPQLYHQFVGSVPEVRAPDFRGNGVRVEAYLPGYAAFVGVLYALGGRWLIVCVQALGGAVIATLLFQEACRLWQARAAALFAVATYLTSLPVLLYVSQIFPSMLASVIAFIAYIMVVRLVPASVGWRKFALGGLIGALTAALPWVHVKYLPLAFVIVIAALWQLATAHSADRAQAWRRRDEGIVDTVTQARTCAAPSTSPRANRPATLNGGRGGSVAAAALIMGLPAVSVALIMWYNLHYFGVWYPQYREPSATNFVRPDLVHMLGLYHQMFLSGQGGLIPWAPQMAMAPLGLVALTRHAPREGGLTALWIIGLLSAFLSSAFAPHVNQAYALPARFTVECQPFFALCVASLFTASWPHLRANARERSKGQRLLARVTGGVGALVALCCLALVGVGAWMCFVGLLDPAALYPSADGEVRLLLQYPHLLPRWWFALFGIRAP